METALEYLLKSAGVLSIFVLIYHFLLRRLTFFNTNRWFLLSGIVASILFPFVEITQTVYLEQPEQLTYLPQQLSTSMAMILQQTPVESTHPYDYALLAFYIYAAISLFFLGKMLVELSSLRSLIKAGNKTRSGKFMMVTLSRKLTPFSFFNYICYSQEDQNTPELDLILDHEKVHAREWHSIDLLLSHVFKALFWINPLVWVLKRQIGENLEFIADSKAATQNTTGMSYERTLLSAVASYKQPALANNFFTPFIKKRILMLQKEASATWNVYKYALILPVIVIFLYSFNVVEEIEYVENTKTRMVHQKDSKFEELVFDITSKTDDKQLEKYRKLIESKMDYQLRFDDLDRDVNDLLKKMSVSAKFPDREWEKGFTVLLTDKDLILLMAYPDKISLHIPKDKITLSIDQNGSKVLVPETDLYGDAPEVTEEATKPIVDFDHSITFKIDATSTKEYLDEKKAYLKKEYKVDFDYSRLKIKNAKVVRIKITLDDNDGYTSSQSYSNDDGIPEICVTGVIKEDSQSWSMGACKANTPRESYSLPSRVSYSVSKNASSIDMDSLMKQVKEQIKNINLEELHLDLQNIQMDIILKEASIQMKNLDIDSLQNELQIQFKKMNMDSLTNTLKMFHFKNPQTAHAFENGISTRPTTAAQIKQGLGKNPPLTIVDGKEMEEEEWKLIHPNFIESITVLEDSAATIKYGEKGKNGVMLIKTASGKQKELEERRFYVQGKRKSLDSVKQKMYITRDSLLVNRSEEMEERRAQALLKREETMADRFENVTIDFLTDHKGHGRLATDKKETFYITDMSKESFEKFQKQLEKAGHTFKLITHHMKSDRLVKLKYKINGSQHTYETNKGIKELQIKFMKGEKTPTITTIPY
ncbi:TonB-dependent receptor plug domain-containing protein [Nonlabens sp. Ci31]|uniref:M56 family metallopeptidase n=1 Tax=Nonlabens sp. Ci31 TaxID=2608253 RepID=UPI00146482FA|nr:M56 family metallopeptidase [Nonlabens sp. Ci31]QJP34801.1 TonB-dependent receptor plug domain-containing protein [Nonlabens sp. Ci31]